MNKKKGEKKQIQGQNVFVEQKFFWEVILCEQSFFIKERKEYEKKNCEKVVLCKKKKYCIHKKGYGQNLYCHYCHYCHDGHYRHYFHYFYCKVSNNILIL